MVAFNNNVVFVLLAFMLVLHGAQLAQGQAAEVSLSCPVGYLVQAARNPCDNFRYSFGVTSNCTACNPPYKRGTYIIGFPDIVPLGVCYLPGQDACNPNPCQNGGVCSYRTDGSGQPVTDEQGTRFLLGFCNCSSTGKTGRFCADENVEAPIPTATVNGVSGPLAVAATGAMLCGQAFAIGCLYPDGKHYTCCTGAVKGFGLSECGPVGPDGVPICPREGFTPTPNDFPPQTPPPTPQPEVPLPTGDQGVCGSGPASDFPFRCWFNNDPQGRYVCCDREGCNGFNPGLGTPRCRNNGYVPPNNGVSGPTPPSTPPSSPPSGDQGVCGGGAASDFPTRCYFNNDPLGRYVCCDGQGCDGFNADNLTPHCRNNGYVPPNNGLSGPTPPSGSQGVCGTGSATDFPVRCWFNSDPQGRYVCCDNDRCNGFNPPDFSFPRCKTNGYVPPGFGI
ncbi:hypothetical protein KFL_000240060 [Klebsormidium nitens]|uniref:EGF-like domain-containing protein n=1 Tax=Klebsormidium nitens TaxID=105231 RepID=A0A1Y1HR57_KLENI|nr:hypothetical protein KFL_000240060 [Klebsormidium nitens]|eukprot:GAQ79076.1 hypothetical protein KFL_000240060 [Klebsormidium nitens]